MKRIVLICLVNVLLFSAILGQSEWIEMKGEIGKFYLSFPSTPTYTQRSFHGWSAKDKEGQVTYLMSYLEAPPSEQMTIAAIEKYLLSSMLLGDTQISKSYLTYSGYNAMDFLYKKETNPTLFKQGRVIVRGQRVYILQVHYYHKELVNFDKFSMSLKLY